MLLAPQMTQREETWDGFKVGDLTPMDHTGTMIACINTMKFFHMYNEVINY